MLRGKRSTRRYDDDFRQTHALRVRGRRWPRPARLAGSAPRPATALTPAGELAPHRAVYDLKLAQTRGNATVAARGRILYDFSGNACEGYALQFRQVSELDNGEGKVALSDLRATTWEDGAAKKLRLQLAELPQREAGRHASTARPSAQPTRSRSS